MIYYVYYIFLEEMNMKNFMRKWSAVVAGLAIMVTTVAVNSACFLLMHQPELPEGAERLRRR